MGYSKLSTVEVFNFMCYKHAKIMFDERNIINLKGYNDSGKSAMFAAIGICMADLYGNKQSKFIRHGEEYFRVILGFDDGVSIVRDKYMNGQSLYEMYKDGELLFSNKHGSRLTRLEGVPDSIKDYLGICNLEQGCLNIQSRDNKMWLVETKGSENYYSLNEILKTEEIARANTLLNSDKNAVGSELTELEADLQDAIFLLHNCSKISEEFIDSLSQREEYAQDLYTRVSTAKKINSTISEFKSLRQLPKVDSMDIRKLKKLTSVESLFLELKNLPELPLVDGLAIRRLKKCEEIEKTFLEIENTYVYPSVDVVEVDRVSALSRIGDSFKALKSLERVVSEDIPVVEVGKVAKLSSIRKSLEELKGMLSMMSRLDDELSTIRTRLERVVEEARNKGIAFVECSNCGTYMEVSLEGK